MSFTVDGAAAAGFGAEVASGVLAVSFPKGIRILAVKQATGVAVANDAEWTLWVDYASTGQVFPAVHTDPVNDGGVKLGPSGITVRPGGVIQMAWVQAVAQANIVSVYYEWA
ncbi:unnamed protein product [marine sediment metagenome]|uniref:Uncharacterized protein n=1 Tax=marine sediment metagenome TaxID=412755 RepID=X1T5A5_9ZZZZ